MSDDGYWLRVRARAGELKSDGCSGPALKGFYGDCCAEHDIHYRTHRTLDGDPITRAEADRRFRCCMQARSRLGRASPMAWWRWLAVRNGGGKPWDA
jgi:hypothetical protein